MHWRKVTLAGVGLLGGSLGRALRQSRLAAEVVGYVRRQDSIEECAQAGAVDSATTDLADAVRGADLIVLCTPLLRMRELADRMLPHLQRGAVVTDVGSVKAPIVQELEPLFSSAGAHFVGSHPMAGAEKMGVQAARADLFSNAVCVVTPTAHTSAEAVRAIQRLWTSVGARLLTMTPELHDDLASRSSHLAHVLAASLASYVLDPVHGPEQAMLCANGFRDTTRVASGSPEMWRDIALSNRGPLADALRVWLAELARFQTALSNSDADSILQFFQQAKERRDRWCAQSASPSPE